MHCGKAKGWLPVTAPDVLQQVGKVKRVSSITLERERRSSNWSGGEVGYYCTLCAAGNLRGIKLGLPGNPLEGIPVGVHGPQMNKSGQSLY